MFCGNCGNKLNNGDTFCGTCGTKVENVQDYNLTISRPGTVMGFAVKLHIDINDESYELGAGDTINLNLPVGEYVVKYKIWCRKEHDVTVRVENGKNASIIFEYDALWGGFKVSKDSNL